MACRVLYLGTAGLACPPLEALHHSNIATVVGVVTQPDRPSGRKLQPQFSPVKQCALNLGLPVLQPDSLRDERAQAQLAALKPDLLVVTAYGQILPQSVLDMAPHGALNIHASILPRHRGAAPIQWAILEGDSETGITIMKMDAGLDTGDIVDVARIPIGTADHAQFIHDELSVLGATLLMDSLPGYLNGNIVPQPQDDSQSTYARKITKQDGAIDWNEPASLILQKLKAFTPWPGIYTHLSAKNRRQLIIIGANHAELTGPAGEVLAVNDSGITIGCGTDSLTVFTVQREGGTPMSVVDFLNGFPMNPGDFLSGSA